MGARSINLALRLRLARRPSVIRLEFGAAGGSSFGASSVAWKMHAPDADRVCVKYGAASHFFPRPPHPHPSLLSRSFMRTVPRARATGDTDTCEAGAKF